MKVVVVATSMVCPATATLHYEGVAHELVVVEDDFSYAETIDRFWKEQEQFINVEHDIVPWPGALEALWDCEHPWCVYEYPIQKETLAPALGVVRFSERLLRDHPYASETWRGTPWWQLDGKIYPYLVAASGSWHTHTPPVSHIKKEF